MRGAPVIAAVVIGTAAVLTGCGQQHGTGAGVAAPARSASSAAGPGPSGSCPGRRQATHGKLTITAADGGMSFCVTRGANVAVFLRGTAARKWSPVHATGGVLRPSANGELALALGVTGASFAAVRPGTAYLTSGRPDCGPGVPPGDGAAGTGSLACDSIRVFRVTVTVIR